MTPAAWPRLTPSSRRLAAHSPAVTPSRSAEALLSRFLWPSARDSFEPLIFAPRANTSTPTNSAPVDTYARTPRARARTRTRGRVRAVDLTRSRRHYPKRSEPSELHDGYDRKGFLWLISVKADRLLSFGRYFRSPRHWRQNKKSLQTIADSRKVYELMSIFAFIIGHNCLWRCSVDSCTAALLPNNQYEVSCHLICWVNVDLRDDLKRVCFSAHSCDRALQNVCQMFVKGKNMLNQRKPLKRLECDF